MNVSFELGLDFLLEEGLPLSAHDLKYGFERGWLGAAALVDYATAEVNNGCQDELVQEVAAVLRRDLNDLPDLLSRLDSPEYVTDPRRSARKWLYLQLKAAYLSRQALKDPLDIVEQIYVAFDYPKAIEDLIRYMPTKPGNKPGLDAIYVRWAAFLEKERLYLQTDPF
jgi:hypothetical protein